MLNGPRAVPAQCDGHGPCYRSVRSFAIGTIRPYEPGVLQEEGSFMPREPMPYFGLEPSARNPVTRTSSASFRGHDPAGSYESRVERGGIWVARTLPWAKKVKCQPFFVEYMDNGVTRTHIPDLLLTGTAIELLLEIKRDKTAVSEDVLRRQRILRPILARYGYRYAIWRQSDIFSEPRYSNAITIIYCRRIPLNDGSLPILFEEFRHARTLDVASLALKLGSRGEAKVYAAIGNGLLDFDRSKRLCNTTDVFRTEALTASLPLYIKRHLHDTPPTLQA